MVVINAVVASIEGGTCFFDESDDEGGIGIGIVNLDGMAACVCLFTSSKLTLGASRAETNTPMELRYFGARWRPIITEIMNR